MYETTMKTKNKSWIMHVQLAMILMKILEASKFTKGEHAAKGTLL